MYFQLAFCFIFHKPKGTKSSIYHFDDWQWRICWNKTPYICDSICVFVKCKQTIENCQNLQSKIQSKAKQNKQTHNSLQTKKHGIQIVFSMWFYMQTKLRAGYGAFYIFFVFLIFSTEKNIVVLLLNFSLFLTINSFKKKKFWIGLFWCVVLNKWLTHFIAWR